MQARSSSSCCTFVILLALEYIYSYWSVQAFSIYSRTKFSASRLSHSTSTALMGIKGFRSWFESQFPSAILGMVAEDSNDVFDHVLVDMNQLLHICVRKSRSDGHGLTLLMKELDAVVALATPTQSLVLAMDGPPSAAKLATQRRRRYSTIVKSEWKLKHLSRLGARRINAKTLARKKRRAASELRTLCITPGTDFMEKAESAILYWAWQRLSSNKSILSKNNVKIFLSPSTVPGEGEVKLLEWIYSKPRKGGSIAILGGDSDLVLEGLVIPPASTHNVFVLLPDGNKRYLSVSLWETTRKLHKYLNHMTAASMMKVRTDLVLLLILNGNDYLPKLRGSSGFNKLFHSYLRLHREWNTKGQGHQAFLIDPDALEFNLPFALAYFRYLAALAPTNLWSRERIDSSSQSTLRTSTLQQLNNLVDGGLLPSPVEFEVIRGEGDEDYDENDIERDYISDDDEEDEDVDDVDADSEGADVEDDSILVRLVLGEAGTEDFYSFEIWHPKGQSLKSARHRLSKMALSELMEVDDSVDDEEEESDGTPGINSSGYEWEIHHAVDGKVDTYMYGLFWNLQTYQDGVCSDYAYNYGKRLSPTAGDIVTFLDDARKENRSVGLKSLSSTSFTAPISAGLSCLAALPSAVKDLVPEPYKRLDDATVETIYSLCMDPKDNYFDMRKFEELCEDQVNKILPNFRNDRDKELKSEVKGGHITGGDHYWTVVLKVGKPLPKPFHPPPPFCDRLSTLRGNNRIRINRIAATDKRRPRSIWGDTSIPTTEQHLSLSEEPKEIIHSFPGTFLTKHTLEAVPYKTAYRKESPRAARHKARLKTAAKPINSRIENPSGTLAVRVHNETGPAGVRIEAFGVTGPPAEPMKTPDGLTAMACLKQLEDAGFVGKMQWTSVRPSTSSNTLSNAEANELVGLTLLAADDDNSILRENLFYEHDRDVNTISKQAIRHHLASLALCDVVGPNWSDLSFKELKKLLVKKPAVEHQSDS